MLHLSASKCNVLSYLGAGGVEGQIAHVRGLYVVYIPS